MGSNQKKRDASSVFERGAELIYLFIIATPAAG
jgi:hypothetical protein